MRKIKVLIIDDSAIVREALSTAVNSAQGMEVIGTAADPYIARDKIARQKPDVITLDIEMPRMDGLTFLKKLMAQLPIPTIIVSSLTKKGGEMSMEAMALGAIDVVSKPGTAYSIKEIIPHLIDLIRASAGMNIEKRIKDIKKSPIKKAALNKTYLTKTTNKIIAIGASTGGTVALEQYLTAMPRNCPGIVIVQHMPMTFTKSFAERLDSICSMEVNEAEEGDSVVPGKALIAPGDFHMVLKRSGARYFVSLVKAPKVYHQRPAVEVLFNSVAKFAGANAVGIMLTGMGKDGATAMLKMKENGAKNIIQNKRTSIVWGMPGEAHNIGAGHYLLPLKEIPLKSLELSRPEA